MGYKRFTEKRKGKNVIPLRNAVCGFDTPKWSIAEESDIQSFLSGDAVDRLADLEDEIDNKTLVKLPCKVGDRIYVIHHGCDGWAPRRGGEIVLTHIVSVLETKCLGFSIDEDYEISVITESYDEEPFGIRAFLTREDAEKGKEKYIEELDKELW